MFTQIPGIKLHSDKVTEKFLNCCESCFKLVWHGRALKKKHFHNRNTYILWYKEKKKTPLHLLLTFLYWHFKARYTFKLSTLVRGQHSVLNRTHARTQTEERCDNASGLDQYHFLHTYRHKTLQSLQECLSPKSVSRITLRHECAYYKNALRNCCTLEWKGDTC